MMKLTIREDDVGRWWSFRCIFIGLSSSEEDLAKHRARRNRVQHLTRKAKKGSYLGMTPVFSFAPCAGSALALCPAVVSSITLTVIVVA